MNPKYENLVLKFKEALVRGDYQKAREIVSQARQIISEEYERDESASETYKKAGWIVGAFETLKQMFGCGNKLRQKISSARNDLGNGLIKLLESDSSLLEISGKLNSLANIQQNIQGGN